MGEKNKKKFMQLFTIIAIIILLFTLYVLLDRTKKLEKRITEQEEVIQRLNSFVSYEKELLKEPKQTDFEKDTDEAVHAISNTISNTISSTPEIMENIANTTTSYIQNQDQESLNNNNPYSLDKAYFVIDPENYKPDHENKTKISSQDKIKQIAQIGFDESAKRIAGEGAENKASEKITTETVSPNNYFTRFQSEHDKIYTDVKVECFVVTRTNEMGCGIKIYIDSVSGLIIGGSAFGD